MKLTRHLLSICFVFCFLINSPASAQIIGSWQTYSSYSICTRNICVDNRVYALMESKLMAYDTEDSSIRTWDNTSGLNDVTVADFAYSEDAKRIIIIYDNSNIDILSVEDDNEVTNIAHLKNSSFQGKNVNSVSVSGSTAYLATGFGLVLVDMENAIIPSTYQLNKSIKTSAVLGDYIYISASDGLWRGNTADNLQDKSKWELVSADYSPSMMSAFDGRLFFCNGNKICRSEADGVSFSEMQNLNPTYWNVSDGCLLYGIGSYTAIWKNWNTRVVYTSSLTWKQVSKRGNIFWASDGVSGLQAYELDTESRTFSLVTPRVLYNSPLHDYSYRLNFAGKRLLVAGGNQNYSSVARPGTAMYMEDGVWTNFDEASVTVAFPKERYRDVTSVAQDPLDAAHHFVGTARSGIFEFREGLCVGHIGLENSPLKSILPNNANPQYFVSADGLRYDDEGNLWMLNCTEGQQDTSIRVRLADGTWTGIPCPEVKDASTMDGIFFDSGGRAWINSRRMSQRGVLMLDYNGTISNSSDDQRYLRTAITNQDGMSYTPDQFYCIAEDANGQIWIGTSVGPFVINNPSEYAASDFTFEQVKVNRNDGSGLADYLFSGTPILAIAIDGANRKWFATSSGVYLISADCQEQLAHFSTENSPMPSDVVFDIAIDDESGTVFFATEKGVCSYVSDATTGVEELKSDDLLVYPNPVAPDYEGPITVRGLTYGCEVKIVSPTGQLIWSGVSNGGTFTWNGCGRNGRRVASGVYIIIANTSDGKKAVTARVAILR
ncbi:MAG: hypothetical protein K6F94_05290 [Bacteroidaceae bacterium]|nr:hypothetical protein [Bacteroidaceae bacterium]